MNAFGLDRNYTVSAMLHNDKHVVKMNIEYCQLMSTAHRVLDGEEYYDKTKNNRRIKRWRLDDVHMENTLYKASHINHPTNIWVRSTVGNYLWMYGLWEALAEEYTHRYGKVHASWEKLHNELAMPPKNIPDALSKKYHRQCQMMSNVMTLLRRIKNTIANTKHTSLSGLTDPHQNLCSHDFNKRRFILR